MACCGSGSRPENRLTSDEWQTGFIIARQRLSRKDVEHESNMQHNRRNDGGRPALAYPQASQGWDRVELLLMGRRGSGCGWSFSRRSAEFPRSRRPLLQPSACGLRPSVSGLKQSMQCPLCDLTATMQFEEVLDPQTREVFQIVRCPECGQRIYLAGAGEAGFDDAPNISR